MTCKELTELVTNDLEGEMPPWRRLDFRLHVWLCRHFRAYVRQTKAAIRMIGMMPEEMTLPECPDELLHRFRNWNT